MMTQSNEAQQVSKKYNDKVQGIRDRLGKTDELESAPVQQQQLPEQKISEAKARRDARAKTPLMNSYMQKFYGRLLIEDKPMTGKDLSNKTGISESLVYDITQAMLNLNLVKAEVLSMRGHPKAYTINTETPLPEGWPTADELKYNVPLINLPKDIKISEEDKLESAKDNPLTKMLMNEGKTVFDTSGYEQFIEDTKTHKYPPELEAVVEMLHKICQERIMNKRIDCPICKEKMERNASELYCKKCNKRIDGGSLEMSLELFRIIAKSEGVKVE